MNIRKYIGKSDGIYFDRQHKFSVRKVLICLYVEKVHRKVFDNQYRQDYILTWKDRPIIIYHSFLLLLFPDFRAYLKYWKPILARAYKLRRLSLIRQTIFWGVLKVNTDRYSAYLLAW